jgi:cysteine desulfurase family protein (TIGR01976 family)
MWNSEWTTWVRRQFPALDREVAGAPAAYFDGPAGTQVPRRVAEAVAQYLLNCNANHGGCFATSQETDRWMEEAHQAGADLLGTDDGETIVFGANMTSLTMSLARALARTWQQGDEIVVTQLEHDANYTPWVLAAADAGVTVRRVAINQSDCTLDLESFQASLTPRTRLVAVGCASNAVGTRNPVQRIVRAARQVGALTFLDAVHYTPHDLVSVQEWGCDFLACSAYKFFGPHVGMLWGRRELLEEIVPYKLRPAPQDLPGRWMTGTQSHEGIAGVMAAIDYLADLGRLIAQDPAASRRAALQSAFASIVPYESNLVWRLIEGLRALPGIRVFGITDPQRASERLPTVAWNHPKLTSRQVATELGKQGFFVWHGNYYALPLTETLGVEPEGMVRVGVVHYNTSDEIDRLLDAVARLPDRLA